MEEEKKDIHDDNSESIELNSNPVNNSSSSQNEESDENSLSEEQKIASLEEENKRLNDLLLRSRAELENFQKRTTKQLQQAQQYSTEKLSSELLVVIDSLEAASALSKKPNLKIEDFVEGNMLLLKTIKEVFEKLNIDEINPLDENFNPDFHQAMATKEHNGPENMVLEVMQKGYKLKSKLLRPALVIVSKKTEKNP